MKILRRDVTLNGPGSVKMTPEEADDLWTAYNLVAKGDTVLSTTVRKVIRDNATGGRDSECMKLKLEIRVESVDYDKEGSVLRIRGKNILENEHVKIGSYHTLEIELYRPFVVRKVVWDSMAVDILKQASDPGASADLAVALMQEGLAHICLIGRRYKHFTAHYFFFENVLQSFLKNVDFNVVRISCYCKSWFHQGTIKFPTFFFSAEKKTVTPIIENKSRIICSTTPDSSMLNHIPLFLCIISLAHRHSLKEVLDAPNVMNMIKDTKAAQEFALKEFFNMLSNYWFLPVLYLLITEAWFR
ncbi:hypothetical protein MKW92_037433, partial [Papaver armeniacum]